MELIWAKSCAHYQGKCCKGKFYFQNKQINFDKKGNTLTMSVPVH